MLKAILFVCSLSVNPAQCTQFTASHVIRGTAVKNVDECEREDLDMIHQMRSGFGVKNLYVRAVCVPEQEA